MTLRELVAQHPEWLDLDLCILRGDGELDFVGAAGSVYVDEHEENGEVTNVIVFAAP